LRLSKFKTGGGGDRWSGYDYRRVAQWIKEPPPITDWKFMNAEEHFTEAILANPDDDTLRLVYADWLEERGDPRGEFIRVQYEMEQPGLEAKHKAELIIREKVLQSLHAEKWLGPLADLRDHILFRHGFPAGIVMDLDLFLEKADLLFRSFPFQCLHLDGLKAFRPLSIPMLVECPHLRHLKQLRLSGEICNLGMRSLAACADLAALEELHLSWSGLELEGVRTLAASPQFGNLTELVIERAAFGDLGLQAICHSPQLKRLRSLSLCHCELTGTGMRYLADAPLLDQLSRLDISANQIGNNGLRSLVASPRFIHLQRFDLTETDVNPLGVDALAVSRYVAGLRELRLSFSSLSRGGLEALAESPHLRGLTDLWLKGGVPLEANKESLKRRFKCTVHFA
jgi:uncharacterized protein (TIGR02996 family)